MLLYRIVHKSFSGSLFASGMQGRWNRTGDKVLYAAESIPLALLENMVRRQGVGFNNDFHIMFILMPEGYSVEVVNAADLSTGWRNPNDYSTCLPIGEKWFREARTLALKVPSAVMPEAFNYVLNTLHPEYTQVKLVAVTDLVPDPRIEDLLKQYR